MCVFFVRARATVGGSPASGTSGEPTAQSLERTLRRATRASEPEDLIETLTRGNPTEVKVVLASVALALRVAAARAHLAHPGVTVAEAMC